MWRVAGVLEGLCWQLDIEGRPGVWRGLRGDDRDDAEDGGSPAGVSLTKESGSGCREPLLASA